MTEDFECRPGRRYAWPARLVPLLVAAWLGCPLPSHAAPRNAIRYIQPVVSRNRVTTYAVCLYSTAEFPMRNSVITLSIGGKTFISSAYVQGGDLHTIIFSLTQSEFQSLKSGDPMAVYYGQDDASIPADQWNFGTFRGVTTAAATTATAMTVHPAVAKRPAPAAVHAAAQGGKK